MQVWAKMILRMQLLKPQAFNAGRQRYFAPPVPIDLRSIGIIAWGHTGARVERTAGARPSRTQAAYAAPPGERVIACSGEEWRARRDSNP